MGRILISCVDADRAAAEALRERLASEGMASQIVTDGNFEREADMSQCRIYILLFSKQVNGSKQMLEALQKAVASGTVVMPLRLTDEKMTNDFNYYLSTIHWLDGTEERLNGAIEQLCRRCASVLSAAESAAPQVSGKKRIVRWLIVLSVVAGIVTAFFLIRSMLGTGSIAPGDMIRFGWYEQDGNASNGPEQIEWIVADVGEEDGALLLVSAQCLEAMPYNDQDTATTWETCSLRQWLNEDFANMAFTESERARILDTHVENSKRGSTMKDSDGIAIFNFDTDAGNDTLDRVYLLNNREFDTYFPQKEYRSVSFTAAATRAGNSDNEWWIRCAGKRQNTAIVVDPSRNRTYRAVDTQGVGVRPVVRITSPR